MPRKPQVLPDRTSLSIREVAAAHGLHEKTVRRMVDRGELRALRFGAALRIPIAELQRLLEAR